MTYCHLRKLFFSFHHSIFIQVSLVPVSGLIELEGSISKYINVHSLTGLLHFFIKGVSNSLWPSDQSVSHTWTHSKVTAVFHRKHSDMNLDTAATFCESNSIQLCERKKSDIPFQLILSYIIIICHLCKGLYKNDFGKLKLRSETSSEQHIC